MTQRSVRVRLHLTREMVFLIIAGVVFSGLYLAFLEYQNSRATAYLAELRKTAPDEYLNEIRKLDGFSAYLEQFRMLKEYEKPKLAAPIFLIGRWTLRDHIQRIPVGSKPECINPLIFEYGRFKVPERDLDLAVMFSLKGSTLVVHPEAGVPFDVKIVSYAASIDHLELVVPGTDRVSYAYRCVQ